MLKKDQISPVSYVYFTLFFISGISGLIYESIWSQYLKQFLGHAAYAQTLVLVIYMGGMALGSWIASVWASKLRNLLLGYAIVEIILGVLALVFHNVFIAYLDASFSTVIPFLGQPVSIVVYKWISASLIILPQSMLLGATFPLMAGGILRRFPGLSGYKTSVIYFVNTFGASIGVLISGFYLVKEWGLRGAIISGGVIDLFVGISILALCWNDKSITNNVKLKGEDNSIGEDSSIIRVEDDAVDIEDIADISTDDIDDDAININTAVSPTNSAALRAPHSAYSKRSYYYPLLAISAATAAASFIYEIGWIRMLSLVLGSSTHSFELMLSAFILGLALGSFFVRNRLDGMKNAPRFLGIVQIVMGATAIMTLFTYSNMFHFMAFTMDGLDRTEEGYIFFNVISHVICMIVMLPSTICAGMVIPLIIHMLLKKGYGEETIGKVYAVNTAGGIVGVVAAVWILMELVGLKYLIIIGAIIDMGIGLYVLYRFKETRYGATRMIAQPVCIAVLVAAFAFGEVDPVLASSGVFRYGRVSTSKRVVEHIDGKTASITLFNSGSSLVLSTNGKPDASVGMTDEYSSDEYTMALLGVLPLTIHDSAHTAAVIGMGAGMTSHFMLYDSGIERLDVVEIEPAMVKLARRIGPKVANTFEDTRCHIYIEDAKTFFAARNRSYDVIVSEPSNPWVSGVSSLFSREFFKHIRNHLNDGGILMQWFHKYEADITILVSILKALSESFPVYDVYMVGSDLLIIAAKDEGADISIKRDVFVIDPMAASLRSMGFTGIDEFKMIRVAGHAILNPLIYTYPTPANSDYHSFVDLHAVKYRFLGSAVTELDDLRDFIIPLNKIIFADTGYLSMTPLAGIPDMYNLREVQSAKTFMQDMILNAHDDGPTGLYVFDYALIYPNKVSFSQIQGAITHVLRRTLPFLSVDEMREIWAIIERKTASRHFEEWEMQWMDFYRAVCHYDLPAMRQLSLEILTETIAEEDMIDNHSGNQMLLTSFLASSIALGDTTRTGRIWYKYTDRKDPPTAILAVKAMIGLSDD